MIVCIDTETTGLVKPGKPMPGITQIATKVYPDGPENDCLVDPEIPEDQWQQEAIDITGITPERVKKEGLPFFLVGNSLARWMVGAKVWMGWNIKHDMEILAYWLKENGMEHAFPWPPTHVDVMLIAYEKCNIQGRNGRKYPKLEEAYEAMYGVKMPDAHDAMADVRATIEIAKKIGGEQLEWLS